MIIFVFLLLNSYINDIHELFQEAEHKKLEKLEKNFVKWDINVKNSTKSIDLQVFKNNNLICKREEKFKVNNELESLKIKLINDDDIIIITNIGLLIYHFNENEKSITLDYYYYMKSDEISKYETIFPKHSNLPLPNYISYEICDGWVSDITNNKEFLLKYGNSLFDFAIKKHKLKLIDEIYKKCLSYFKQDFRNNMFLSIITTAMPSLNEYYPEYIEKYSLETTMTVDSPYCIEYQNNDLHLSSFQHSQVINLTRSILWIKYALSMKSLYNYELVMSSILGFFQSLLILLLLPIYFATFYILSIFNFINDSMTKKIYSKNFYFKVTKIFSKNKETKRRPTIIFTNPYIKFVNYPKEYNWFKELIKPQPSSFVKTINKDIYKTWNGKALLNFKWKTYGIYYHLLIWIGYITLLACFNAAAIISQQDIQKRLLITSIILGSIYLILEVRQFIYDPIGWIYDFLNIIGINFNFTFQKFY
jgi:hypothetical protein